MNKLKAMIIMLVELVVFLSVTYYAYENWSLISLLLYVPFIILWDQRKLIYKKLKK